MAWPSPQPADLTFDLGRHSRLELPVRQQEVILAPFAISEVLRPPEPGAPRPHTTIAPVGSGRYLIENNSPPHERTITDTGSILSRESWETSEIRERDYSSSVSNQRIVAHWKRVDWDCSVVARCELRADTSEFHLVETVVVRSTGKTIFEHRRSSDIPHELV